MVIGVWFGRSGESFGEISVHFGEISVHFGLGTVQNVVFGLYLAENRTYK